MASNPHFGRRDAEHPAAQVYISWVQLFVACPPPPEEYCRFALSLFPYEPLPLFSRSSKIPTAADSIQTFGMSKPRLISVSMPSGCSANGVTVAQRSAN